MSVTVLARRLGVPGGAELASWTPGVRLAGAAAATIWLIVLLGRRDRVPRWAPYAATAVGAVALAAPLLPATGGRAGYRVAFAALIAWTALEAARSQGIRARTLITLGTKATGWERAIAFSFPAACLYLSMAFTTVGFQLLAGSPQALRRAQEQGLEWSADAGLVLPVASILYTCVLEELVLVAAVAVLGRAAGLPFLLIVVISVAARVGIHSYLGLPALAVIVLGVTAMLLYRRHQTLLPLLAAHALFDTVAVLAQQ
ncbi:CPBP family glutamic-type intramembrane protease [Streptomyces klenkii]|uniref:CPBP family glutamic-type intramembrane protease n=1 Tax=Streptomyces klenkii TaxID=1420899 RepID=UPI00344A58E6